MTSLATNSATDVASGSTGSRRSHHAPTATMPMMLVARVPANATAYSASPPRSVATSGMTVVTASAWVAARKIIATAPRVTQKYRACHTPPAPEAARAVSARGALSAPLTGSRA